MQNGNNNGNGNHNQGNQQYIVRIQDLGGNQNQVNQYMQMSQQAQFLHFQNEANYLNNRAQLLIDQFQGGVQIQNISQIFPSYNSFYMLMHYFHEPILRNQGRSIISTLIGKMNQFQIEAPIIVDDLPILNFVRLESNLLTPIANLNLIAQVHQLFFPNLD